ncbi:TIGR02530 family flagellar biosynthesis protein [Cohnella terricola]|uniref:Flagellar biosynthesis protein n=1 Tax=Cohnella terricola TaxID=1289167 RepID=A0A559JCQ8_9BACL|nr:TIGR02530 family flagellar biosynthesis protein [Cohnella terricola]TVX97661.1 flagellar biosynthesis protein [Cohnella terricola]
MNNPMLVGHLTTGRTGPIQGNPVLDRNKQTGSDSISFREVLSREQLKFSHHAEQRLQQRGIELLPEQISRIASAVDQAAAKGARDSLVLFHDIAMIVNVPNRTVVTAMDGSSMKEHIFTQIDSAVVVS